MAILFPNVPATLRQQQGYDLQSKPAWGRGLAIKVAIVTLKNKVERSSVRADSSASRGRVDEARADGIVLVPAGIEVGLQDRLVLLGVTYEVASVFPRIGLDGQLGHSQIELRILVGV
jgi:hypothetical protein